MMNGGCYNILMSLAGFGALVVSQVFIFRLMPRNGLLKSLLFGFVFGLLNEAGFILYFFTRAADFYKFSIGDCFVNVITYCCLAYCYFHFVNLGETARRIRILRELKETPGGLTQSDILARYNAGEIINRRLERLVANRQVVVKDGRYFIATPVVLYMAKFMFFLKAILFKEKLEWKD